MKRLWALFLFTAMLPPMASAQSSALPRLTFQNGTITVSGVTPRARVYAFGVTREPHGDDSSVIQRETVLSDDDGDGTVQWTLPIDVPKRSIWMAVDLESGAAAATGPPDYQTTRIDLTGEHLKKDASQSVSRIASPGALVEVVVVRAKGGIWRATVGWRGPADESKDPKTIGIATANLQPQAGTTEPAPKHLKKGDVVFVLDSYRATYGMATVGD
jgi:hypothetical protein